MSFQGDVRGIGLAELLQGLARGRKEGVLTLNAKTGMRVTLGMEEGVIYLLPAPNEEAEMWRDRVRNAWADDPHFRIDYLRMSEIAHADRLEGLYRLLDGDGVHFRFDPGPLPSKPNANETVREDQKTEVYCEGSAVEFLLLEYARLADELESLGEAGELSPDLIPCVLDPNAATGSLERFFKECNGNSTMLEIADRLSWPLRQVRLSVAKAMQAGTIRLSHAHEVLNLALYELARKNFSRAAGRFSSWCRDGRSGAVTLEEADALSNEWLAGRLAAALRGMSAKDVRTLLRRMDHGLKNLSTAVVHWAEANRVYRTDRIIRLHRIVCEYREGSDPALPDPREVLDLAREFRDAGQARRSGPLLVIVARQEPTQAGLQLELGQGLVSAGRPEEGAPWIVAGASELLERGSADRAVVALRMLVEADPGHREARQILSRARRSSTHVKKLRKNLLIGLAVTAMVSAAAFVKLRSDEDADNRIGEVRALLKDPIAARALLDEYFPGDVSKDVAVLRQEIFESERAVEIVKRGEWNDLYVQVQTECSIGDPVEGLKLAIEMPEPPDLRILQEPWPDRRDLFTGLAKNVEAKLDDLGAPLVGSTHQVSAEQEIGASIRKMKGMLEELEASVQVTGLLDELGVLKEILGRRQEQRDDEIAKALERETLDLQNELLVKAQGHARNGDYARALRDYEELLSKDTSGKVSEVLDQEIELVRVKHAAVQEARRLAVEGLHEEALAVLEEALEEPMAFLLPWTVQSFPTGAAVTLENGSLRTTPFVIETTFADKAKMVFNAEGYVRVEHVFDGPANRMVYLSRESDRGWKAEGRIDALPVAVDEDHIVVDRKGRLSRIGPEGEERWSNYIETLSGIARSPVFLPRRPGFLLLVTEDGEAWLIDAADGALEGPWELGSAPVSGPYPTENVVRALLKDGRVARWRSRLKPTIFEQSEVTEVDDENRYGAHSGMEVLRQGVDVETRLQCKWNEWVVEIEDDVFRVFKGDKRDDGYTVARAGEWQYVGWEAPHVDLPDGRLWISDGTSVRAFVP